MGPSPIVNYHGQLAKIKQEGRVRPYVEEFRHLQTLVTGWSEEALMGTFIDGLKPWLAKEVKLKQPNSMQEAMRMAEILDDGYQSERRMIKDTINREAKAMPTKVPWKGKDAVGSNPKNNQPQVKRLSREEVQDFIKRGLCFKCGEKWGRDHKCKSGQAFLIEVQDAEFEDAETNQSSDHEEEQNHNQPSQVQADESDAELSLNALTGVPKPSTMRLLAWVGRNEVSLLVDSGSSHNFINAAIVPKLGYILQNIQPFEVKVANGEKLTCKGSHTRSEDEHSRVRIKADLHVIQLVDLDIILGSVWLRSVGKVNTNYETMTMDFKLNGKKEKWTAIQGQEQPQAIEDPWLLQEEKEFICIRDDLIFYKSNVYVPDVPNLRHDILSHFHNSKEGGHSEWFRTYVRIKHFFYWEGLKKDVKTMVAECDICQKVKYDPRLPMGLLQPLPIPNQIWEDISMDFIEGLPSSKGYEVVLVVVDRLSKYAHFIPVQHPFTAKTIAQTFVENIIRLHGVPRSIISDRDKIFMSLFWKELFSLQGSMLKAGSSYHPQTDGQTEVTNRILEQYLRCYCHEQQNRWADYLPWAEYWYNTSYQGSTKKSPFELVYGRTPPTLTRYEIGTTKNFEVEKELLAREEVLKIVKRELKKSQERMKKFHDRKRRDGELQPGDYVYLKLQPTQQKSLRKRVSYKLAKRYYGPYKILERIGKVAYKLELPYNSLLHPVFHISWLKKRVGDPSTIGVELPKFDEEGRIVLQPMKVLQCRIKRKGRNKRKVWQVLMQWKDIPIEDATWEEYDEVARKYPKFHLEDKEVLQEGGNGEVPPNSPHQISQIMKAKAEQEQGSCPPSGLLSFLGAQPRFGHPWQARAGPLATPTGHSSGAPKTADLRPGRHCNRDNRQAKRTKRKANPLAGRAKPEFQPHARIGCLWSKPLRAPHQQATDIRTGTGAAKFHSLN
ncbi:uncharacterized protein LOC120109046 [Phoenix dactylifera]|uniref:Uncharacterized protein LOC120109046 n=1 Tax=Phoenix dactylifera TaxID=42345 RepID=A0A8B9A4E0_PHODC|nr:uncharacterized protein LOC120109046 [Phoenix dactylifera]